MNWTSEVDQIIIANRGLLSAAGIAQLIGQDVTRNAVLGRINRLGLPKIKHAVIGGRPRRPQRINGERKVRTAPVKEFVSPPIPVSPLNVPFLNLEKQHCREIVGSEGYGQSLSCGHPVIHESSFCRWHHSVNFTSRNAA